MSEVVHDGLSSLPDSDIRALAVYLADLNGSATHSADSEARLATLIESSTVDPRASHPGLLLALLAFVRLWVKASAAVCSSASAGSRGQYSGC